MVKIALTLAVLTFTYAGLSAHSALAATVESVELDKASGLYAIVLKGDIVDGDLARFRKEAIQHPNAVVDLNSDGGKLVEALEIGKIIRINGYSTVVLDGDQCDSGCALIWLAGQRRLLGHHAKVGFHASYLEESGTARESGVANALVGNYLAMLNLPQSAVIFATSSPPSGMNYLTVANAAGAGITAEPFGDADPEPTPKAQAPERYIPIDFGTVGGWTLKVDTSLGNGCFMAASYDNHVTFRYGYDMRGGVAATYVLLGGEYWQSLKEGQHYQVAIQVGSNPAWQLDMVGGVMDGFHILTAAIPGTVDKFQRELESSAAVRVQYWGTEITGVTLENSRAAIARLRECQQRYPASRDPFAK